MSKSNSEIVDSFVQAGENLNNMRETFEAYAIYGATPEEIFKYKRMLAGVRRELQELDNDLTIKMGEWKNND